MLSFSFGIVLWEIATRKRPFEGVCRRSHQQPTDVSCLLNLLLWPTGFLSDNQAAWVHGLVSRDAAELRNCIKRDYWSAGWRIPLHFSHSAPRCSVCLDFPHCTVAAEHLQSVSQYCHPYSQVTSMAKSTAMLNLLQRVLTFPAGWSSQQIYQRVCKEEFQEPLPDDCPEALRHLIHACRASCSFKRPSAGGKYHHCPLTMKND